MTELHERLAARIAREGPLTVAEYMAACLGDPTHGYYRAGERLGAQGDFITAPEASQIFGELIGAWAATMWAALGRPQPCRLIELGPGRGVLMSDALRLAASVAPDFAAAIDLHLVEINVTLRARQAERLAAAKPCWHLDLATVPAGPLIIIANEFFDALPIRQFQRQPDGWHERLIGLAEDDRRLTFMLGPALASPPIPARHRAAPIDDIVEIGEAAATLIAAIADRILRDGGVALIVDYGPPPGALGDSLQAVRGHQRRDPLAAPGEADLSAHVDFESLAEAASAAGLGVFGPLPQGLWLTRLGLFQRAAALMKRASAAEAMAIEAACRRLVHPTEMGGMFRLVAVTRTGLEPPPGFAPP